MATPSEDRVTIRVGGLEHRDWTSYSIDSDLLTPADAWRVTLGIPAASIPASIAPWALVEVRLGADLILTGRLDNLEREVSKDTQRLSLSGRDGAAVLVDCSAPIFTRRQASLAEVVDLVARPLGVDKVRVEQEGRKEKISVEPGQRAWDLLAEACEANGVWAWFEPDGTLVVGGPDYSAAPVATLVMAFDGKANNVTSLAVRQNVTGRYSEVTVLGQTHGTEDQDGRHDIMHRETDPDVPGYRPLIIPAGECDNVEEAKRRARKKLMDSRLEGFEMVATVRGHRVGGQSGEPWRPGMRVNVISEPHGLDGTYFLMKRTFLGGRDRGRITELVLKEDGVWLPELAGKAASTGKKGKKGPGETVDLW
uniref:Phage tail protein n=1 Tax=Fundidesulfovibrio putealis TaxID=270496 RepID=A0A7C4EK82_9BACT